MQNIPKVEIEIVQLHGIVKICILAKIMRSVVKIRIGLLKREPIKAQSIIPYIEKHFFGFLYIIYD